MCHWVGKRFLPGVPVELLAEGAEAAAGGGADGAGAFAEDGAGGGGVEAEDGAQQDGFGLVGGQGGDQGDGAAVNDESELAIKAKQDSEILLFDLA